jgi:hypothetical protein
VPTRRPPQTPVVLFALTAAAVGGSATAPFPELHPLTGTVTRDGKPVTGGGLMFAPDPAGGPGLIVNAAVEGDGSFTAQTLRTEADGTLRVRPGAPAGRYRVIYHPPGNGSKTGLEVELDGRVKVGPRPNRVALLLPRELPGGDGMPRDDDPTAPPPGPKPEANGPAEAKGEGGERN